MTTKHRYLSPTVTMAPISEEDILRTSPTIGDGDDEKGDWGPIVPAV